MQRRLHLPRPDDAAIHAAFVSLRDELDVSFGFSGPVLADANAAVGAPRLAVVDETHIPFLTIDPPGSRDLDQALHIGRRGSGYVGEVCVAVSAGTPVPAWVRAALPGLPETMAKSNRRAQQYEGGIISVVEAAVLEPSVGRVFDAVVVDVDEHDDAGTVQLQEPAVTARCEGKNLPLGERVVVRLEVADVARRQVQFVLAE